jgi:SAM-dependent methyltransferase
MRQTAIRAPRRLVGVDISEGMLEHAKGKNIYHALMKTELTDCVRNSSEIFDLIVSSDTLVYFGDLKGITAAFAGALRPNGLLVFTLEQALSISDGVDYRLELHGRYSHARGYVERLLTCPSRKFRSRGLGNMRRNRPASQTSRTLLRNQADPIAAIDLCLVHTATFERLFVLIVIGHGRRQLLWFAVTRHPKAEWSAQQIVEAFPWDTAPAYLVRDNDSFYGQVFMNRLRSMGIRDRPDITKIALAEPLCRTGHRDGSAGNAWIMY